MVSGANTAPESIRSGEFPPNRSVRLSGDTDCVTAPFKSAPASPTVCLSTSCDDAEFSLSNRSFVIEEPLGMQALSAAHQRLVGSRVTEAKSPTRNHASLASL